jgi:anaerobic glycerol-3-phosphate dehydrogenase
MMRPVLHESQRQFNANLCSITRVRLTSFTRSFPTEIVFANGSTLSVRYETPRAIIRVPLIDQDLKTDKQRSAWLARRKVKEVIVIRKDLSDVQYDSSNYLKYV